MNQDQENKEIISETKNRFMKSDLSDFKEKEDEGFRADKKDFLIDKLQQI